MALVIPKYVSIPDIHYKNLALRRADVTAFWLDIRKHDLREPTSFGSLHLLADAHILQTVNENVHIHSYGNAEGRGLALTEGNCFNGVFMLG